MGSLPDYLLGRLYDDYENPKRSRDSARRHFTAVVKSDEPIEDAFLQLASLERSHAHTVRILKHRLRCFSKSKAFLQFTAFRASWQGRKALFDLESPVISFAQNGFAILGHQSSHAVHRHLYQQLIWGKRAKKTAYPKLSDTGQSR